MAGPSIVPGKIIRAVVGTWVDAITPSDVLQITPHFQIVNTIADADVFATAVLTAWKNLMPALFQTSCQHMCKLYDAQGTVPNYPITTVMQNPGVVQPSVTNRDVAVCLSYFSTYNRPRLRGRLYVPCTLVSITPSAASVSSTDRAKVLALGAGLAAVGGTDANWGVWSRVGQAFHPTTDVYVDDAWDSQRRRGKRPAARSTAVVAG